MRACPHFEFTGSCQTEFFLGGEKFGYSYYPVEQSPGLSGPGLFLLSEKFTVNSDEANAGNRSG